MRDIIAELEEERRGATGQRPGQQSAEQFLDDPEGNPQLNIFEQMALEEQQANEAVEAIGMRSWGKRHPLYGNVNRKIAFAVLTGRLKMMDGAQKAIVELWLNELEYEVKLT